MAFRFAAILGVFLVGLMGAIGVVWSLAPNGAANDPTIAAASPMTLAATSAEFKECKTNCFRQANCESIPKKRVLQSPEKTACLAKRKACVQACPK